eukprot:TRINITY_DN7362_c0_g1_i1.p1 TRINITY_DN7362_c0_g1~~TRINITY_DN7362_c0_g1_i1.p1  ORF type:complete len:465 (-),score=-6.56 TRINITY_DN7362_c0_g1_i1:213-1478(-)
MARRTPSSVGRRAIPVLGSLAVVSFLLALTSRLGRIALADSAVPRPEGAEETASTAGARLLKERSSGGGAADVESSSVRDSKLPKCNLDAGRWVRNPWRPQPYSGYTCQSVRATFNCQRNGLASTEYLNYDWRAPNCNIAFMNPLKFLRLMRNKVFLAVGDGTITNYFAAVRCLVESVTQTREFQGVLLNTGVQAQGFDAPAFNATFLTMPSNFLVRAEPMSGGTPDVSKPWRVFLSEPSPDWVQLLRYSHFVLYAAGHWFTDAPPKTRLYIAKGRVVTNLTPFTAMQAALTTVRQFTTASRYRGLPMVLTLSATHTGVAYSGVTGVASCKKSYLPLDSSQLGFVELSSNAMQARNAQVQVFKNFTRFKIIDVTRATLYRPDAHVKMYGTGGGMDCSQWCVPGVPDSWADIMYSYMIGAMS